MKFYKLIILILSAHAVLAQRENENWIFNGNNWKFNLTTGNLTTLPFGAYNMYDFQGFASISNPNTGDLLFYSDGKRIYNKNMNSMLFTLSGSSQDINTFYGSSMGGSGNGLSTDQPVIIVPHPGNANLYYVFFNGNYTTRIMYYTDIHEDLDGYENLSRTIRTINLGLQYSIVDMSLNGGLGGVVSTTTTVLLAGVGEGLTSSLHSDGTSYWLIAQKGSSFYSYKIGTSGLVTTPVISNVAPNNQGDFIKISPNSEHLFSQNLLYDFNNSTGQVTNPLDFLPTIDKYPYQGKQGVYAEFSPDSNILYFIGSEGNLCMFGCPRWDSGLFMYNLQTGSLAGGYNFDEYTFPIGISSLQLGPNNKIYLTSSTPYNSNNFGADLININNAWAVIENPNTWSPTVNPVSSWTNSVRNLAFTFPQLIPTPPPCPVNLNIMTPITSSQDFQVSNKIEASSVVYQNFNVNFRGSQIILKPGFSVSGYNTGVFRAVVDPCSAGLISPIKEKTNFTDDKITFQEPVLFPNPTTTILNIDNIEDIQEWKLVDINGKTVESGKVNNSIQTKITINTSRLIPGVYYFNAVIKNGELFQKTVMKK